MFYFSIIFYISITVSLLACSSGSILRLSLVWHSLTVSFVKSILYKLYNPIVTVFKDQVFLQRTAKGRLLLKLFSLFAIKRLTSALKQTIIVRHSFGTVKTMLTFSNHTLCLYPHYCSNNVLKCYL